MKDNHVKSLILSLMPFQKLLAVNFFVWYKFIKFKKNNKEKMNIHDTVRSNFSYLHIKNLVDAQPNLRDARDSKGRYSIHIAIKQSRLDLLQLLMPIKIEQNITRFNCSNAKDNKGYSPLAKAIRKGSIVCFNEIMKWCFLKEHSSYALSNQGKLPLHLTILKSQFAMLKHLLVNYPDACKQSFTVCNQSNQNPISYAASIRSLLAIRLLLDHGDNIDNITDQNFKKVYQDLTRDYPRNQYLFPPRNLIFRGGGAKGIIYSGSLHALEEENMLVNVERVAGTSAGAITASLLAVGYTANEISEILKKPANFLDWSDMARDLLTFDYKNGAFSGTNFLIWLDKAIEMKTGIAHCTFGELAQMIQDGKPFKHLHVFALRLNTKELVRFDSENIKWRDLIISDAVRTSMSLPLIYKTHSIIFKEKSDGIWKYRTESSSCKNITSYEVISAMKKPKEHEYVDGGGIYNFPKDAFDRRGYIKKNTPQDRFNKRKVNQSILGITLYNEEKQKNKENANKEQANNATAFGVLNDFYSNKNNKRKSLQIFEQDPDLVNRNKDCIIKISDCGISTFNFNLTSLKPEGQIGIRTGYVTLKNVFSEKLKELAPLNLNKKVTLRDHKFLLLEPERLPFFNSRDGTPLLNAVKSDNMFDFHEILKTNVDLTILDPDSGKTILHLLIENWRTKTALDFINIAKDRGALPKLISAENNLIHSIMFTVLKYYIASENALYKDEDDYPIYSAHQNNLHWILETLLVHKIDINKRNPNNNKPLLYELIELNGCRIMGFYCESLSRYPLNIQKEILDEEVESGENDLRYWGQKIFKTALIRAVQRKKRNVVELLIKQGADYKSPVDGYRPIDYAKSSDMKALLKK